MSWPERLDGLPAGTVGLEEEVLLLDPQTLEPLPAGERALAALPDDGRFKLEMPAAQIELVTRPHRAVDAAVAELAQSRETLVAAIGGWALPAAAAVHPTAPDEVELNGGPRYEETLARYGFVARRQLVGALHVHVAVGGAERSLAVYNALRGYLPELAALAAAAPLHGGRDTGFASVRPLIGGQLPRQGVPPALPSWAGLETELEWGRAAGSLDDPGRWWWELRPHHRHATLELRVADVQPSLDRTAAVARFAVALVRWLAARHDAGERLGAPPDWRIAENRWAALRHGMTGTLADLETGARVPTRDRLHALTEAVSTHADGPLEATRSLIERNAALDLREVGVAGASRWLAAAFSG